MSAAITTMMDQQNIISRSDNLNKEAVVETETPVDAIAYIKDQIASDWSYVAETITARIIAVRGYFGDLYSNTSHQKKLCIGDSGNETCLTKTQIDQLMNMAGAAAAPNNAPSSTPNGASTTPPTESSTSTPENSASSTPPADAGTTPPLDTGPAPDPVVPSP